MDTFLASVESERGKVIDAGSRSGVHDKRNIASKSGWLQEGVNDRLQ